MRRLIAIAALSLLLSACGDADTQEEPNPAAANDQVSADYGYETYGADNLADTMASNDTLALNGVSERDPADDDIPDSKERPIMQAQVVLDRVGFGPGIIDGKMGMSTENALRGFQEANDLEVTGKLDENTKSALANWDRIPATRVVTVPAAWSEDTYVDIPEETAEKAELERLGYKSLDERLAERFHTTVGVLKELNPGGRPAGMSAQSSGTSTAATSDEASSKDSSATADAKKSATDKSYFTAGQQIRVPNIGADRIEKGSIDDRDWQRTLASLGVGTEQAEVDRVVVSKSGQTLKAYQGDELVALFTVSSGSSQFPLPLGEWDIVGKAYNPPYKYDPEVLSGGREDGETYTLPPGPISPVGVVWIDLSKEHYGIHGTPHPETIGRAQSSGCVRLTNWDAARLAQMVSQSTRMIFEA